MVLNSFNYLFTFYSKFKFKPRLLGRQSLVRNGKGIPRECEVTFGRDRLRFPISKPHFSILGVSQWVRPHSYGKIYIVYII